MWRTLFCSVCELSSGIILFSDFSSVQHLSCSSFDCMNTVINDLWSHEALTQLIHSALLRHSWISILTREQLETNKTSSMQDQRKNPDLFHEVQRNGRLFYSSSSNPKATINDSSKPVIFNLVVHVDLQKQVQPHICFAKLCKMPLASQFHRKSSYKILNF